MQTLIEQVWQRGRVTESVFPTCSQMTPMLLGQGAPSLPGGRREPQIPKTEGGVDVFREYLCLLLLQLQPPPRPALRFLFPQH